MAEWIWVAVAAWICMNFMILGCTMLTAKRRAALDGGEAADPLPKNAGPRGGGA
ncbi:hypothetical protein [Rubrimonas cliftonensis]|uniref:Heme exporter protein D n=1 Tax=Rubrimonas cliftonensis TaxID=89524 RepID=A0A1H4G086_9RHOB|nr:hypothetical protein [Rubrimonas cliftonensis]SEB03056.1 hypothetical protein SAMN05444370_13312 [Rubrimonas cliftonensis]